MLRSVDLQLLGIGAVVGAAVPLAVTAVRRLVSRGSPRQIGAIGILMSVVAAVRLDDRYTGGLPDPLVPRTGAILGGLVVVAVAGHGARRLPSAPGRVPLLLLLVAAQLAGVWAGVPETSAALLALGLVAGMTALAAGGGMTITRGGAYGLVALPVLATLVGAVGAARPALGGLLVSAPLVLAAVAPRRGRTITSERCAIAVALQLVGAASAARLVAVQDRWESALLGVVVTLTLSVFAVQALRGPGQPRS